MTTQYSVVAVTRPRDIATATNGKLPTSVLTAVNPVKDRGWSMHHLAARAWEAMRAAAWKDGVLLSVSGNPYRSYEGQVALFRDRYRSTTPTSIDSTGRVWNGVRYYRTSGAPCAVPGTSNHGWGLAIDLALDADRDAAFEWPPRSLDAAALAWLRVNAPRFGFSWEGTPGTSSFETWHLRYVRAEAIPQAVLDFERGTVTPPPPPAPSRPTLRIGATGKAVRELQTLLTRAGFTTTVDGSFGPRTDASVRAFQRANGLVADGIVGPRTWSRLI